MQGVTLHTPYQPPPSPWNFNNVRITGIAFAALNVLLIASELVKVHPLHQMRIVHLSLIWTNLFYILGVDLFSSALKLYHVILIGVLFTSTILSYSIMASVVDIMNWKVSPLETILKICFYVGIVFPYHNNVGPAWMKVISCTLFDEDEFYTALLQTKESRQLALTNETFNDCPIEFRLPLLVKAALLMSDEELEDFINNIEGRYKVPCSAICYNAKEKYPQINQRILSFLEAKRVEMREKCIQLLQRCFQEEKANELYNELQLFSVQTAKYKKLAEALDQPRLIEEWQQLHAEISDPTIMQPLLLQCHFGDESDTPIYDLYPHLFNENECEEFLHQMGIEPVRDQTALLTLMKEFENRGLYTKKQLEGAHLYPLAGTAQEQRGKLIKGVRGDAFWTTVWKAITIAKKLFSIITITAASLLTLRQYPFLLGILLLNRSHRFWIALLNTLPPFAKSPYRTAARTLAIDLIAAQIPGFQLIQFERQYKELTTLFE